MDVLDENEALQQFFEGKSSVAAMLSTSEQCLLTFTLSLARSVHLGFAVGRMLSDNP